MCIGNICRSPTAEYLFRRKLGSADITISSAGLGAMVGHPIDPTAMQLLTEHGIDAVAHRARQLTPAMLLDAELVLGMEQSHVDSMTRMVPAASGRVFTLNKWLQARDIPDPYGQQRPAFEHVYHLISDGVDSWLPYL